MNKKRLFIPLMTAMTLASCGVGESVSSDLDIVNGTRVAGNSSSVERMGTVSLGGCTATAIARDLVLTAAHCVGGRVRVSFQVPGGQQTSVGVAQVIAHPLYRSQRSPNTDVAVIKLSRDMPATHRVIPMLTNAAQANNGKTAVQAGYGSTKDGNGKQTDSGRFLRRALTRITGHRITSTGGSINVRNGSTVSGGTAACSGDSGGPLYVQVNNKWYTAGVTSTARAGAGSRGGNLNCSGGNTYASIAGNFEWITDTARQLTRNRRNTFDPANLLYN